MPGEEKVEKFELGKDPAFAEMQKMFRGLVTIVQQQGAAMTQMRTLLEKGATAPKGKDKDDDDDDDDDVDVDKLSNKEFMALMMKNVGGLLDEKIGTVAKKVDGVAQTVNTKEITTQYNDLKGKHKDFEEWADEMKALSQENPTLSLKRLYTLARQENPDKAKTLDDKYVEKKDVKDDSLTLFGGYRPTTKTSGEGGKDGKTREKLSIDQALDKAWEEAVDKVPALGKMDDALD